MVKKITSINSDITDSDFKEETFVDTQFTLKEIQLHIHIIREQQVILDEDLADMYGIETKRLNEAVKRNIERFPERFMFQITQKEFDSLKHFIDTAENLECLRSQIATLKNCRGHHRKYLPYAFTEQGVTQLSSVLKSKTAIEVSIRIMDAFVAMRRFISANAGIFQRIERLEQHQIHTDQKIEMVLQRMDELAPTITPEQIFATGCVWDAWNYVSQLIRSAKQRIILIDNFIDERVLTLLTKRKNDVSATLHSRYSKQFNLDLEKHNEQYEKVNFFQLPHKSHDRFLIIDNDVYLLGASVKDMGSSLCAITKMKISPDSVLALIK